MDERYFVGGVGACFLTPEGELVRASRNEDFGQIEVESPNGNLWFVCRAPYRNQVVYVVARREEACQENTAFAVFDTEEAGMEFVMEYIEDNENYDGTPWSGPDH
jgi:hypothetical protein